jgi:hypothetical protein
MDWQWLYQQKLTSNKGRARDQERAPLGVAARRTRFEALANAWYLQLMMRQVSRRELSWPSMKREFTLVWMIQMYFCKEDNKRHRPSSGPLGTGPVLSAISKNRQRHQKIRTLIPFKCRSCRLVPELYTTGESAFVLVRRGKKSNNAKPGYGSLFISPQFSLVERRLSNRICERTLEHLEIALGATLKKFDFFDSGAVLSNSKTVGWCSFVSVVGRTSDRQPTRFVPIGKTVEEKSQCRLLLTFELF